GQRIRPAARAVQRRRRGRRRADPALRQGPGVRAGRHLPGRGHRAARGRGLPAGLGLAAAAAGGAPDRAGARQRRPRGVRPRPAHRPVRVRPHARPERAGGAGGGRARGVPHPMSRPMDGQAEIARFLQQLKWIVLGLVGLWVVWLLAPILTPFVFGALLGWMGDPLVDRLERAGRSRNVAVALVFGLMTLLLVLALLILVPMLERQVRTLVESLPAYRDWFVQTAVPWLEARTGL